MQLPSRNPVLQGFSSTPQPLCQPLNCLIWTTASAHSCSEKLEEGEGDQFCSGHLSLPSCYRAVWSSTTVVTAGACWLHCRQTSSTKFSFRLHSNKNRHTSSSTHITGLLSLLQPPHIIFPLRPRGGALCSFLWLFCSDIAGTDMPPHLNILSAKPFLPGVIWGVPQAAVLGFATTWWLGMSSCFQP